MRLDKFVADFLNISRNDVKQILKNKQIKVNGQIITDGSLAIKEDQDIVCFNDDKIVFEKYIYLMMNKPNGYLSATHDDFSSTIMDLVPKEYMLKGLNIVGRLDKDTEGLILLSNDGDFIHNLTSPKKHVSKKYYVEFNSELRDDSFEIVKNGVQIDDYTTLPGILERVNSNTAYITIYEGKFHEVKKIFNKLGTNVTYLKRVSIAKLELGDLELGKVKKLTKDDLELLKE